ncbi:ParB/RepB/Spo0J family partition protein [Plastorhodobacter daqingensis]|uniref:ParB/RepB/Spo0J family partition protein n=1 Tax=Plastorhodobacter daqingensis TaxID=1387281 RepID=A0ABW2UL68_9RHOB
MAKRRRLDAPSPADLADLETGFAAKPVSPFAAPIAQVAAETARAAEPLPPADRAAAAAAEALRRAEAEGRLIRDLPLDAVFLEHLVRDRMVVSGPDMEELKTSLRLNGQRLPIEVVDLGGERYGLISGWRRVTALRALAAESGEPGQVRALIRPAQETAAAYAAMVEENELREQLTPYERGRIAVVAADQGAFRSPDDAVDAIFAAASKAKRSKIRSFALVHEELGDMLSFPTDLSERSGLRIAQALRLGLGPKLREALATGMGVDPAKEIAVMEPVLARADAASRETSRGGRPRRTAAPRAPGPDDRIPLANGVTMERVRHDDGYSIRLRGRVVDGPFIETVMRELERLLEPI